MRKLLLSSAIAVVLAAPAFAASNPAQSNQAANVVSTHTTGNHMAPGDWVQLTSADHLVGRDVRSKDGKQAGEIDGLVLDLPQGRVIYALIGSGGDLDIGNDRIAVPFQALRTPLSGSDAPVVISQDLSKISSGTRVTEDRVADLGSQERMKPDLRRVWNCHAARLCCASSAERDLHPYRYVLLRPDQSHIMGSGAGARAQDIRGSEVQRSNGDTLGEIDQVMIDPARGRIAYLLLSSGGFLGIGNDWLPVPPEAVAWSPDKDAYVLNDKNVKPAAMQVLHKTDLPGEVQRAQLEALYQRFNLRPYWEGGTSQNQG